MGEHYKIAVIGSGPGGYIAALKAAQMGVKTAVVEYAPLGGTCLNSGCIPSKALLASAELIHQASHAKQMGVIIDGDIRPDWTAIQKRKDSIIRRLRGGIGNLFKARKIDLYEGRGRLNGPGKVAVESSKGENSEFTAEKIILAVGSYPVRIPGWPDDKSLMCTSDEALHWDTLPKKVLIVGGGIIGLEFACLLQPMGVDVTVVEMMPDILPGMDESLPKPLRNIMKKRGVKFHIDTKVEDMKQSGDGMAATLSNGETIEADRVLVAVGRGPATKDVGLETVGLETSKRGFIEVNDKMETSVKDIYCIGDANGRVLLAHAASAQGVAAVKNALGHDEPFTAPVPGAVYTFPEIGAVGMTRQQAREQGIPVSVGDFPIGHLGKAMAVNDTDGFARTIRHRETDEILGVHMLGHNVTESIAAATALVHTRATVEDMADVVIAHPSISESLKESAEDALGAALHLPPRKVIRVTADVS